MAITFEEAKRRKAVANMIISEINVLETLQNTAPISDAEEYLSRELSGTAGTDSSTAPSSSRLPSRPQRLAAA